MKKIFTLILVLFAFIVIVNAQKNVVYATNLRSDKVEGSWDEDNDVVIQMLKADANFNVTVKILDEGGIDIATSAPVDFSGYDVIILHDGLGSSDTFWQSGFPGYIGSLPAPAIFDKIYALRNEKALTTGTGASTNAEGVYSLTVVDGAHDLFKSIDVSSGVIPVLHGGVHDNSDTGTRGLQYNTGNILSAENTLLAYPEGAADVVMSFSDIPAGSLIDDATLANRLIVLGFNVGVTRNASYENKCAMTVAGLTIWRNAIYSLAGLTVPDTPADFDFLSSIYSISNSREIVAYGIPGGIKVPAEMNLSIFTIAGQLVEKNVNADFVAAKPGIYLVKATKGFAKVVVTE